LWLIKVWFSASIPIAIGMLKIAAFAKPKTVVNHDFARFCDKRKILKGAN
jgi:hypothetical protein